jgi:hypothetical protein
MKKTVWARLLAGLLILKDVRGSSARWFFHRLALFFSNKPTLIAEIWLMRMLMLICCERKTLFVH